jgi:hypothetical protein
VGRRGGGGVDAHGDDLQAESEDLRVAGVSRLPRR